MDKVVAIKVEKKSRARVHRSFDSVAVFFPRILNGPRRREIQTRDFKTM